MPYPLTTEQELIIDKVVNSDEQLVKVEAVAGSSKSFTSNKVSLAMGKGLQLYIVFSKSMQQEAKKELRGNVQVTTAHSYAYKPVMSLNLRLDKPSTKPRTLGFLKARDLVEVSWDIRYEVLDAMEIFFASKEATVAKALKGYELDVIQHTELYVKRMFDNNIPITHSGYLKYFHLLLLNDKIPNKPTYDLAILDECQDVSEVVLEIFKLTNAHKYLIVGDSAQAIFSSFTHTVNAFDLLQDHGLNCTLSKSFRVTKTIAKKVEKFCKTYISSTMKFEGMEYDIVKINTHMYINRTNSALVKTMIKLIGEGTKFSSAREPSRIFELSLILLNLKKGMKVYSHMYKYIEKDIHTYFGSTNLQIKFTSPTKYLLHQHQGDTELKGALALNSKYSAASILEASKKSQEYYKEGNPYPIWVATAHSSKGFTVDEVTLQPDMNVAFQKVLTETSELDLHDWNKAQRTEALLYYVACTRARHILNNSTHLKDVT